MNGCNKDIVAALLSFHKEKFIQENSCPGILPHKFDMEEMKVVRLLANSERQKEKNPYDSFLTQKISSSYLR